MGRLTIIDIEHKICSMLEKAKKLFVKEIRLTFIARLPGNPEADIVLTDDTLEEIQNVVLRSIQRNAAIARKALKEIEGE